MDNITVDVGDAEVAVGDAATLIGADGDERVTAEELARTLGTINYEITCGVSARVPRVHLRVVSALAERLERSAAVRTVLERAARDVDAWLVGGTVRDALLETPRSTSPTWSSRATPSRVARALARARRTRSCSRCRSGSARGA